ncbi:MAG: tetratricopeptide repeat protein [Candidatus Cloacimonetes bacterium]|nr:tetratricopeptide repeat protein [Candidatus Cloacimonadota bacterium]
MSEWEMLQKGILHHRKGEYDQARTEYQAILSKNREHADANHLLGLLLLQTNEVDQAETFVELALKQNKKNSDYAKTLAQIFFKKNQASRALGLLDRYNPPNTQMDKVQWYGLRGDLAYILGRASQAMVDYEKVLALEPENQAVLLNLGILYTQKKRFSEAEALLSKALIYNPQSLDVEKAIACLNQINGNLHLCASQFMQVFQKDPRDLSSAQNASMALLALGDFKNGWDYYRLRSSVLVNGGTVQPDVGPDFSFSGKSVCILREQGLGDELFFMRFAPQLIRAGAVRVFYQSDSKVLSVLKRALPQVEIDTDFSHKHFDVRVSLGDLPYLLFHQNLPKTPESLKVKPLSEHVEQVLKRWPPLTSAPWIGLTWRAGGQPAGEAQKTRWLEKEIPLEHIRNLIVSLKRPVLVLQRNPEPKELALLRSLCEREGLLFLDLSPVNEDIEMMLAVLSLVQDYVCVSNTNVHLREMLGKPTHVLVPFPPEFRYQVASHTSPWFSSVKVYRQQVLGSWFEACEQLKENLS